VVSAAAFGVARVVRRVQARRAPAASPATAAGPAEVDDEG